VKAPPAKGQLSDKQVSELSEADLDRLVPVNVNGKVEKVPVRELLSERQLKQVSHQKMQEAAEFKKQLQSEAKQFVEWAKSNPREFLKQTGIDPYEFAESTLAEKLKLMQMTEGERRALELEEENKRLKARFEQDEKKAKETAEQEQYRKEAEALDATLIESMRKAGLPTELQHGGKYYMSQIAHVMLGAARRGEQMSTDKAASIVRATVNGHLPQLLAAIGDDDTLLSTLGDAVLKRIRNAEVKRVTAKATTQQSATRPGSQSVTRKKTQPLSEREWRAWQEQLKGE